MYKNIKFRHFRPFNGTVFTVASRRRQIDATYDQFDYAVAFCSAKDQFSRKHGSALAAERLKNLDDRFSSSIVMRRDRVHSGTVNMLILTDMLANIDLPRNGEGAILDELSWTLTF